MAGMNIGYQKADVIALHHTVHIQITFQYNAAVSIVRVLKYHPKKYIPNLLILQRIKTKIKHAYSHIYTNKNTILRYTNKYRLKHKTVYEYIHLKSM